MRVFRMIHRLLTSVVIAWHLTACAVANEPTPGPSIESAEIVSIYWSDGDSGRLIYDSGEKVPFRINDIDAPETGGVGAAIGGAKCEQERALGYEAKAWAVEFTKGAELAVTGDHGADRHGRNIYDLSANGQDVGQSGIKAGVYRSWRHDGKKQLEPRPKWCAIVE